MWSGVGVLESVALVWNFLRKECKEKILFLAFVNLDFGGLGRRKQEVQLLLQPIESL